MAATQFNEPNHRRHGKGTRQTGRFAPKPAHTVADGAPPRPLWHLLLWKAPYQFEEGFNPHIYRGQSSDSSSYAHSRWTATAPSAAEAVRGQMKEAARRMGMGRSSLADLDSGWMDGLIADIPDGGACAPLPLIVRERNMIYLQAGPRPPSPDAETVNPPKRCRTPRDLFDEAEKLAPGCGRSVSTAVEALRARKNDLSALRPHMVCPKNPSLFVETLALQNRRDLLKKTLLGNGRFDESAAHSRDPKDDPRTVNGGLLMSGLYARLLDGLPFDPFATTRTTPIMRNFIAQRRTCGMYRPSYWYMHADQYGVSHTHDHRHEYRRGMSTGVILLRAAAAPSSDIMYPEAVQRKADALAAAARRSETGAVVGFATGIFPPDSPAAEAAVDQLLDDASNRWCDPDGFRRKIVTLHACSAEGQLIKQLPQRQIAQMSTTRKCASERLDAALSVVVGEPGQPVTHAEAECVRTLLVDRGRLIEDGSLAGSFTPYRPIAPQKYSTLSRQQQMSCLHHAKPELALPRAATKLTARTGDYARWVIAHDNRDEARRLTEALLTAPDLPAAQVAGLFMLQQKALQPETSL